MVFTNQITIFLHIIESRNICYYTFFGLPGDIEIWTLT